MILISGNLICTTVQNQNESAIETDCEDYAHGSSGDKLFQINTAEFKDEIQGDRVRLDAYHKTTNTAANAAVSISGNDRLQINAAADTKTNLGERN